MSLHVRRPQVDIGYFLFPTFLRHLLSRDLQGTILTRLAGQWAPTIFLSLHPSSACLRWHLYLGPRVYVTNFSCLSFFFYCELSHSPLTSCLLYSSCVCSCTEPSMVTRSQIIIYFQSVSVTETEAYHFWPARKFVRFAYLHLPTLESEAQLLIPSFFCGCQDFEFRLSCFSYKHCYSLGQPFFQP